MEFVLAPVFLEDVFRVDALPAAGFLDEVAREPLLREPLDRAVPDRVPLERVPLERVPLERVPLELEVRRRSAPSVVDFLLEDFEGADLPPAPVVFLVAAFFALRRVARATALSRRSTRCEARRICPSSPGVSSRQSPTERPFNFSGPRATRRSFFTG